MRDRTGWKRGTAGPQLVRGKKYRNLVEYSRPCATCNQPFSVYVTEKIAEGLADSNAFGLKNCEIHRRGGVPASNEELETLRSKDRVMSEEVSGLYAHNKELAAEVQALKERLAKYELQPALETGFPWGGIKNSS